MTTASPASSQEAGPAAPEPGAPAMAPHPLEDGAPATTPRGDADADADAASGGDDGYVRGHA